jgi:hypothetical protein
LRSWRARCSRGERVRARQGAVLLAVAILCVAAERTMFAEEPTPRALVFASTFFLLASIGRSLVVLLVEVRAARHLGGHPMLIPGAPRRRIGPRGSPHHLSNPLDSPAAEARVADGGQARRRDIGETFVLVRQL